MKSDKQEQKVGSDSTAIQAGGDVTITQNKGLSVAEVKELCLLFLRENFPILREEARKEAEENVQKFAVSLESKIIERSEEILLEKFADPDVQAAINDAVQANARKGERANPSILVDLIIERTSFTKDDFRDIVLSEAITVVPKLTKSQISYLSFIHYMTKMHVKDRKHISQLEQYSRTILSAVSESFDLSESQKKHIQYTGACSILSVVGLEIDVYDIWMNHHYKDMEYTDIEKFKSDLAGFSPSSKILLDVFDKDNKNNVVTLTSVGQAIAIANLSMIVGKMDYSIWLK